MSIPIFITITKPNIPKYETITYVCDTFEDCQNKLIVNLKNIINKKIDYPEDVDDFSTNYWYNDYAMDNEFFDYNLYHNNQWVKPWTLQELYDDVINIINQVDIQDSIYNDNNYYDNEEED